MRVLQRIVRGAEDATGLFPTFCPRSEKVQKKDSEHSYQTLHINIFTLVPQYQSQIHHTATLTF